MFVRNIYGAALYLGVLLMLCIQPGYLVWNVDRTSNRHFVWIVRYGLADAMMQIGHFHEIGVVADVGGFVAAAAAAESWKAKPMKKEDLQLAGGLIWSGWIKTIISVIFSNCLRHHMLNQTIRIKSFFYFLIK